MTQFKLQNSETPFFVLQKKTLSTAQRVDQDSHKLVKLHYLLQNSKMGSFFVRQKEESETSKQKTVDVSKDVSLYASLVRKPINLLFSLDQFLFEFTKKTYQKKKPGEFFQQLKERKKVSLFYGHVSQKSLAKVFHEAMQSKGFFSKNVVCLLERRLDVVLYRSGFTQTIAESRQCIAHKKVSVNGNPVTFPSFGVEPGDILSLVPTTRTQRHESLLRSLQTRQSQNFQKSFGARSWIAQDFFSKLQKNLTPLPKFSTSSHVSDSKLVYSLITFLCTQLKNRASYTLKHTTLSQISSSLRRGRGGVLQGDTKLFLTFLKWNILGKKAPNTMTSSTPPFPPSFRNQKERVLYPKLGYIRHHPVFWSRHLMDLRYTPFVFGKNQGHFFKFHKKNPHNVFLNTKRMTQKNGKKRGLLERYRDCFLVFLKHLETKKKFRSLVHLHFKKSMSPQFSGFLGLKRQRGAPFFSKQKEFFSKTLAFRVMKPLHLEISYKLFHVIYLYSPQRVNFPFYIDLDLIRRSLR